MNVNKTLIALLSLATLGVSGMPQAHAGGFSDDHGYHARHAEHGTCYSKIDRRQHRQLARIREGIRSGELTRPEVRVLRKQQRKIARMEHRFERDGHLDKSERRRLHKALDRASRRIARAKHNDERRHLARRTLRDGHAGLGYLAGRIHR